MANTIVNMQLPSGKSGLTITLYPLDSDTAGNTPDTLTEETNRLGLYSATITEALNGTFYAKVLDGTELFASGWVALADTTSTYHIMDGYSDAISVASHNDTSTVLSIVSTTATDVLDVAGDVWDQAVSSHNVAGSFGKFVRQLKEGVVSAEADVNDVSATTTSFVTTLTEASDSHYSDLSVAFISGALTGQSRVATAYNGTTKTLTFDEAWSEAPADGDTFIILTPHIHTVSQLVDGVWDELISGHLTAGTTGASLNQAASGAGTGARTITVTVDDGTNPLENATVRYTEGVNTFTADTDASGNATFSLDDATYSVAIFKDGYTFTPTTLIVSGDASPTYSMTANAAIGSSNAGFATGYTYVYDENGAVEVGVTLTLQCIAAPSGSGLVLDTATRTATSDSNGKAEFTNLVRGAKYQVYRNSAIQKQFTASDAATFEIPSFIGSD
ncbi:MAG: hypothetical protein ACPG4Q_11345 [Phycisphaeraceae bacterium]